eukprot:236768-Pyramimonas_sp.AAC.1
MTDPAPVGRSLGPGGGFSWPRDGGRELGLRQVCILLAEYSATSIRSTLGALHLGACALPCMRGSWEVKGAPDSRDKVALVELEWNGTMVHT